MKVRVKLNLMKWEVCKAMGETPEAFDKRMQWFIDGCNNEIERYEESLKNAKSAESKKYFEDCINYNIRRAKRLNREVRKAYANA